MGGEAAVSDRVTGDSLSEKVAFEEKPEGSDHEKS